MSSGTKISWTGRTWNPVSGCTKISNGCERCYIERTPPFRIEHRKFDQPGIGATTGVMLHPDRLAQPLRWRDPQRVFVCSLADLFHDAVPDEFIARVWAVMAATPRNTYQVLTKRSARMRNLLTDDAWLAEAAAQYRMLEIGEPEDLPWPLPNVWCGVTAENQQWADIRIPALLDTPAAVRWVSVEPMLGPVNLDPYVARRLPVTDDYDDAPDGAVVFGMERVGGEWIRRSGIDWVVVGGESGPGARPMELGWAEQIVEQCQESAVPVFVKQLGSAGDRKDHQDMATFPEHLRVRQYPTAVTA